MRHPARHVALLALLLCSLTQAATKIEVYPDKETGVYAAGDTVTWKVDAKTLTGKLTWKLLLGGAEEIGKGEAELADGKATLTGTRKDPGVLLLEVHLKDTDGKDVLGKGGAIFSPEKIERSAPVPDDFDAFWKGKVEELNKIPMNVQLSAPDTSVAGVEYYKITMDNINGSKIYGQIAKPAGKNENLPIMLQVQYAGVYPLQKDWATGPAKQGWLAMNIIAHDLPIDEKPEFYKEKAAKELDDYPGIGNDNRDTSYFLRMFLSCYRACDYLVARPEWNKKTLLVQGGSQGGYQTLMIAGFHPAVTAYAANVPAGCDHTGKAAHRAPGWPNWASRVWQTTTRAPDAPKKDYAKMLETSRYFDCMNFATRIKAPGLIGMGLVDSTCPPEGVYATINQIKAEKKVIIMPRSGHGADGPGHGAYYKEYGPFLEEQRKK